MSTPSSEESSKDSYDLSLNRPGATLRAKSLEIRRAHPVLVAILRLLGAHHEERAWRRGAEGEEEVAFQLRKLDATWRVLHSVPIGKNDADIDHVVIGPPGVFTLNTKNHLGGRVKVNSKAIYVNGKYQPYLTKSRAEGARAAKLVRNACGFDVVVSPVIVVMASELTVKGAPEDVNVVGRKKIAKWLGSRNPVLDTLTVERIYDVARQSSTWSN